MTAFAFQHGAPTWVAILSSLGSGLGFGVLNALLITGIGLPPFIATLGKTKRS